MEITIRLDGSEGASRLLRLADAVKALAGEKATSTIELKMDGSAIKKALDETLATFNRDELATEAEIVANDEANRVHVATDNAIAEAASKFGKQPLPAEATGPLAPAPSPAAADPSTTAPAVPPVFSTVAPVPPVPAAASTPAPPVASPAPAATVDKNGLPWDERIHSSSRAMNADGSWRAKRGVQGALVAQVEAELRAQTPVPAAPVTTAPTPPVPAAPGVNHTVPAPPAGEEKLTFQTAVARIGPKLRDGTITPEKFLEAMAPFGFTQLHQLNNQPHGTLAAVCAALGV